MLSAIGEEIDGYVDLCGLYGEPVQRSRNGMPDCNGKHADNLKARLRDDEVRRRDSEAYLVLCRLLDQGVHYVKYQGRLVTDCFGSHAKSLFLSIKRLRASLARGKKRATVKRRLRPPQAIKHR